MWDAFRDEFRKKIIPKVVRDKRGEEFIGLKQRALTVAQYEIQFTKLSKYAPEMINTEEKRKRRFLQGLNVELQRILMRPRKVLYILRIKLVELAINNLGLEKFKKISLENLN